MNTPNLEVIQHWIKDVLVGQGSLTDKIVENNKKTGIPIEALIKQKKGIAVERRLDIYASGYVLRLLECMQADFPALKAFLGAEVFELFAKAYIVTLPSSSWSLYDLGASFANFLKNTQPKTKERQLMLELPAQIALLERAKSQALLAKGTENEMLFEPNYLGLSFDWYQGSKILKTPDCLQLITLDYPIASLVDELIGDEALMYPEPQITYMAITRRSYRLLQLQLEPWQYQFLEGCQKGMTLDEVIKITTLSNNMTQGELQARLSIWLPAAFKTSLVLPFA